MKLHNDINAFAMLLDDIHDKTGYRSDVLEKDYYVVLLLEELAKKQEEGLLAYFKGGTALYKALHTTNRFSEDIDLSVDTRGCSRTQSDKRLENATKKYSYLFRDASQGKTNRSEITSIYTYNPITNFDEDDALQRFGKVKIEATSFTISEPVTSLGIVPLLYELATSEQREILTNIYDVRPFDIKTITVERIFVDKIFAAEAYVRKAEIRAKAFEAAKHIYDLTIMAKLPKITSLISEEELLNKILMIRLKEELDRLDGIPGLLPKNFIFFDNIKNNKLIINAYETMQNQYVLRECDKIDYDDVVESLGRVKKILTSNNVWCNAVVPKND